jgi:hypothetical protein
MIERTMPNQVFDALKVILDEFGDTDLPPRLRYYAEEYPDDPDNPGEGSERGRQLLRAFNLVTRWHVHPNMDADDIRDSLEDSDGWWKGYNCEAA